MIAKRTRRPAPSRITQDQPGKLARSHMVMRSNDKGTMNPQDFSRSSHGQTSFDEGACPKVLLPLNPRSDGTVPTAETGVALFIGG